MEDATREGFVIDLSKLISYHDFDKACATPASFLADYVVECLVAQEKMLKRREEWLGHSGGDKAPQKPPPRTYSPEQ